MAGALRVLLVFGVLWWIYGGYVWLSNARTPARTPERLLMLVGMAGFLIMGLAIPHAFGRDGVALGLGYLIVVVIHASLYQRVNRNIARVAPFNLAAAILVIAAGLVQGGAAVRPVGGGARGPVALPAGLPLRGRFAIRPAHFTERHGALVIIVFGESVVDIGIGAGGHAVTVRPRAVGGPRAGADRRALVDLLRRGRRRAGRAGHDPGRPRRPARAGPRRLLLRLHPHAARDRRARRRGQAGHRAHRGHHALPGLPGPGRRCGPVPGRRRGVQARAADRHAALPGHGGDRGAGSLRGRGDGRAWWPRSPC